MSLRSFGCLILLPVLGISGSDLPIDRYPALGDGGKIDRLAESNGADYSPRSFPNASSVIEKKLIPPEEVVAGAAVDEAVVPGGSNVTTTTTTTTKRKKGSSRSPKTKRYRGIDRRPSARSSTKRRRVVEDGKPRMESLRYETIVRSRYARTTVTGSVKNWGRVEDKVNVNVVFPRKALVTKFQTTVDDRTVEATVAKKNDTTSPPRRSSLGKNVGTIPVESRDCDAVTIPVDLPGLSTLNYTLTYEYLLERNFGFYSVPVTLHTNAWIRDLRVRWIIQEERNLTLVKVPLIHGTNALPADDSDDPTICLKHGDPGMVRVVWRPTMTEQKNISLRLGESRKEGLSGILELRYDVLRDLDPCGQIVRQGEYFGQFFVAPDEPSLAKHVVFVLDVSDSMQGDPIEQLKIAMNYILDTLRPNDRFTLINFSDEVVIMNIHNRTKDTVYRGVGEGPEGRGKKSGKTAWPGNLESYEATASNVAAAKEAIRTMDLRVFTNIYDALVMGLKAVRDATSLPPAASGQAHPESVIVFLTDGHASDGPSYENEVILKMVEDQNRRTRATVFALGFGGEADMRLLRRLALATSGIEKHIYKGTDAADQLVKFFRSIGAPVLKDVFFRYSPKQVTTWTLTKQRFPLLHRGKEIVVAGKLDAAYSKGWRLYAEMTALGRYSVVGCERAASKLRRSSGRTFLGRRRRSSDTVERIWAFATLNRLRDELELDRWTTSRQRTRCDDELGPLDRMLEICLRLNYATPGVTDLVYDGTVVERSSVSPERLDGQEPEEGRSDHLPAKYPWMRQIGDKRGLAKLPIGDVQEGRMYAYLSLGVDENPPAGRSCGNTVEGSPGECRYLPECPDPRVLGSPEKFQKHFCRLGSFAGVCCSDSVPRSDDSTG